MKTNQNNHIRFQYCIKLGQGKYASLLISQSSDISHEVSKLCNLHNLQSDIMQLLQNDIYQEMKKHQKISNSQGYGSRPQSGKIIKNNKNRDRTLTETAQMSLLYNRGFNQQSKSIQKDSKAVKSRENKGINQHFQKMYKRYEQIQYKKQISRKASQQKIPFRPSINKLSQKIMDMKRSRDSSASKNFKCVIYKNLKDKQQSNNSASMKKVMRIRN